MKPSQEELDTISSYDAYGQAWADAHQDFEFWPLELERFKTYLSKGKILEIGSGGGRDAKKLIAAGYEYTGTDISKGLLEAAKKNNPGGLFLQKSVYDLNFS